MTNLNINLKDAVALNTNNQIASMTSQEIADLVQARHDNVKTSIERLIASAVIVQPAMKDEQTFDALGRSRTTQVYVFEGEQGKRDSTIVVAQLSPQFTAKLVDRWIELEQATQIKLPSTYKEALLALVVAEEEKEQLVLQVVEQQQVIEVQQVDVDALERISCRKGSMTMRDAAKLLNMRPMDLRDWMLENNWTYSPYQDCYRPTAAHSNAGHLVLSANDYKPLVRVTWKGLVLLSKKLKVTLDVE
ncbi:phage antirepressor KilAC domain-containing protein [Acinetobacter baumannii]|uniref:phage antirepressor KilAC domain-containing protein n=1 Tax=Acinetobacter baumannii TaxID=470 RepID=UPI003CFBDF21